LAKRKGVYKGQKRGKELKRQEKQAKKRQRRFGKGNAQKDTERADGEVGD